MKKKREKLKKKSVVVGEKKFENSCEIWMQWRGYESSHILSSSLFLN